MKRSTKKMMGIITLIPILSLAYTNCSQSGNRMVFSSAVTPSVALSETSPGQFEFQKLVNAEETVSKSLDIVWVIDNSGSMGQEAAHVRNNLQAFISSLEAVTSIRVAVLSGEGTSSTQVSIGVQNENRLHINRSVSSTNSLELLSDAFCRADRTECSASGTHVGQLASFFRPDANKVFVLVTDDNSRISAEEFGRRFDASYPGEVPAVFSFIGLGREASPCQARQGTVYETLSASSLGKVYNICEPTWDQHFSDLTGAVASLSVPEIALPRASSEIEILEVTLDGVRLTSRDFQIGARGVQLATELFNERRSQILKVVYRLR